MNGENVTILEKFCRTCMIADKENESGNTEVVSIFDDADFYECKGVKIMDLLLLTVPQLNIDRGDMLPKKLCGKCLENLISAYKFQSMCVTAEQNFRQMIQGGYSSESENTKDQLKNSIKNTSKGKSLELLLKKDSSNFSQSELDEPLIDVNNSLFCSNTAIDSDDTNCQVSICRWQDATDSDSKTYESENEMEVIQEYNVLETSFEKKEFKQKNETIEKHKILNNSVQDESEMFSCDKCGNRFKTRKSLTRHEKIHLKNETNFNDEIPSSSKIQDNENKKFECDECGNNFTLKRSLTRHKKIHLRALVEAKREPPIRGECKICKKVYNHLDAHLRIHTYERPFLCAECGKAFRTKNCLKEHLQRHGTDRKFVCPYCPKRFISHSDLATHKATHNKLKKNHVCDVCGAGFLKPSQLKTHKMYHTGEKNYKCEYCEMRFVLAEQCRRHMRIHTGEKPYKCKYCEKAYAQPNDLIKHLRMHLGDNVYKCSLCPQGFRLQRDLRDHFMTHKNDDEETKERNLQALKNEDQTLKLTQCLVTSE